MSTWQSFSTNVNYIDIFNTTVSISNLNNQKFVSAKSLLLILFVYMFSKIKTSFGFNTQFCCLKLFVS